MPTFSWELAFVAAQLFLVNLTEVCLVLKVNGSLCGMSAISYAKERSLPRRSWGGR